MSLPLLSRLWSHAREVLTRLRATLMPLDTLDKKERRALSQWLAALESFARRIVLLEAYAVLDREPSGSHSHRRITAGLKARSPRTSKRAPCLRLWPSPKHTGPRIRLLGPPTSVREIWRDQHRAGLIASLAIARTRRRPPHKRLADRIDALESLISAPRRAARRLAHKLAQTPKLALKLACAITRPGPHLDETLLHQAHNAVWPGARALNSS
jgi:hypothetical protein